MTDSWRRHLPGFRPGESGLARARDGTDRHTALASFEVAPQPWSGHAANAQHAVAPAVAEHTVAGNEDQLAQRGIVPEMRRRLRVNRSAESEEKRSHRRGIGRVERADEHEGTRHSSEELGERRRIGGVHYRLDASACHLQRGYRAVDQRLVEADVEVQRARAIPGVQLRAVL